MNHKLILTFSLALSSTSAFAVTDNITEFLTSPPYIGVSFSMGEGVQYEIPSFYLTSTAIPWETQQYVKSQLKLDKSK